MAVSSENPLDKLHLEIAGVAYKVVGFLASAFVIPAILWFAYTTWGMLKTANEDIGTLSGKLSLLQQEVSLKSGYQIADLDAAKQQIRALTAAVGELKTSVEVLSHDAETLTVAMNKARVRLRVRSR